MTDTAPPPTLDTKRLTPMRARPFSVLENATQHGESAQQAHTLRQSRTPVGQIGEDGCVKAIDPDNGDGDREAVPGVRPEVERAPDVTSLTLDVDGEMFALSPNESGGADYTWLSGPNPGYGFGVSPAPNRSVDEHMENIRDFLAHVDPATGYIEDD
jgi:hypothetical protein